MSTLFFFWNILVSLLWITTTSFSGSTRKAFSIQNPTCTQVKFLKSSFLCLYFRYINKHFTSRKMDLSNVYFWRHQICNFYLNDSCIWSKQYWHQPTGQHGNLVNLAKCLYSVSIYAVKTLGGLIWLLGVFCRSFIYIDNLFLLAVNCLSNILSFSVCLRPFDTVLLIKYDFYFGLSDWVFISQATAIVASAGLPPFAAKPSNRFLLHTCYKEWCHSNKLVFHGTNHFW